MKITTALASIVALATGTICLLGACVSNAKPTCPKGQDVYLCEVVWWAPGVTRTADNCLTRNQRWFCGASKAAVLLLVQEGLIRSIQANPKLNDLQLGFGCVADGTPTQQPNDFATNPTFNPQDGPSLPGWDTYGSNACDSNVPTDGSLAGQTDAGPAATSICTAAAAALAANAGGAVTVDACGSCFVTNCCAAYVASTDQAQATQELSCIAQTGTPCAGTVVLPGDSSFVGCMNVYCGAQCSTSSSP